MLVECPFCKHPCDVMTAITYCGHCYVEFYTDRNGDIVFDDKRKTERFAFAKALNKTGGISIGAVDNQENSADVCPCGAPAVMAGWCEECIEYVADEHDPNG